MGIFKWYTVTAKSTELQNGGMVVVTMVASRLALRGLKRPANSVRSPAMHHHGITCTDWSKCTNRMGKVNIMLNKSTIYFPGHQASY